MAINRGFHAHAQVRLIILKSHWQHMGANSGFPLSDVLSSILPPTQVEVLPLSQSVPVTPWHLRVARKLRGFPNPNSLPDIDANAGSPWATERHRILARAALSKLDRHQNSVLLLPAAEDELCPEFACAGIDQKKRIFICFHQPPSWFRLHWRRLEDLNSFGGIICLAEDQAEFFRSACQTPVHLIRHGVRHDFFRPPVEFTERKGNRLLFVGQWLRDFETLANAMLLIWSSNPNIKLDCVVPRFARDSVHLRQLAMDKRVSWHSDLPDVKLRRLYQEADLLFLPVLDAVANNAVLEALASGLPVVSTQVGGMVNYLPTCAGLLCKSRDSQSHAEAVCELMNSPSARIEAGNCARRFAVQHHDWGRIGRQLLDFIVIQSHTVCPDLNDQGRRRAGVN